MSPDAALDAGERTALVAIARRALIAAARRAAPPEVGPLAGRLARPGASFVTLHAADGALRGCIGSLEPRRPLGEDVAANARAAALDDTRFEPLAAGELEGIRFEISVLSALEPLAAGSRRELLAWLRPGVDGLLLDDGVRRATFLPAVWVQLPEPERFLAQLERKAGLPGGKWPRGLRAWRYGVEELPAARVAG